MIIRAPLGFKGVQSLYASFFFLYDIERDMCMYVRKLSKRVEVSVYIRAQKNNHSNSALFSLGLDPVVIFIPFFSMRIRDRASFRLKSRQLDYFDREFFEKKFITNQYTSISQCSCLFQHFCTQGTLFMICIGGQNSEKTSHRRHF